MGMGFAAGHAEVIEPEQVAKLTPKSWPRIVQLLTEDGFDVDADGLQVLHHLWDDDVFGVDSLEPKEHTPLNDDSESRSTDYRMALEALGHEFTQNTQVGDSKLTLQLGYHDSDANGDRYDDVNGAYFCVDGVYVPSEAAKPLIAGGVIARQFFVTLG